jgi:hypothetical protein
MTKRFSLTLTIFICLSLSLLIQDCLATQWARTYGGDSMDAALSAQQTSDGGYIVAGRTGSFGGYDMWILKLDGNGNINNCDIFSTDTMTLESTMISGANSNAIIYTPSPSIVDTTVNPQSPLVEVETQCFASDWFTTAPPLSGKTQRSLGLPLYGSNTNP